MRSSALILAPAIALSALPALAQTTIAAPAAAPSPGSGQTVDTPLLATQPGSAPADAAAPANRQRSWYYTDPDSYGIISTGHGLSFHKPMFVLPATWSEDHHGAKTEMIFDISFKQRLFGIPLYFGYTQKSFFDVFDSADSKPLRASDYNPELFYRWVPKDTERWHHLGADFGIEHESNGQALPDSRSWNRVYFAPFQAEGHHLIYWKWWWRLPEDESKPRTDPGRDDNPDIEDYYGWSELTLEQQFSHKQLAHAMIRYNPGSGRGALNLQYTIPNNAADPDFFWTIYLFQGYGEDLIDYNHSVTRIGFGVSLAR